MEEHIYENEKEKFLVICSQVLLGDHNDIVALLITLMTIKRRIWITQKTLPLQMYW